MEMESEEGSKAVSLEQNHDNKLKFEVESRENSYNMEDVGQNKQLNESIPQNENGMEMYINTDYIQAAAAAAAINNENLSNSVDSKMTGHDEIESSVNKNVRQSEEGMEINGKTEDIQAVSNDKNVSNLKDLNDCRMTEYNKDMVVPENKSTRQSEDGMEMNNDSESVQAATASNSNTDEASIGNVVNDENNKHAEEENVNADAPLSSYTYEVDGQSITVPLDTDPSNMLTNNDKAISETDNKDSSNSENASLLADSGEGGISMESDAASAKFTCDICNKKYSCRRNLTRHALIHSGEKPHECEVCGRCFAIRSYLASHMKTHMKESYFCSFCDKRFSSTETLKLHMPVHVVDNMLNLENKPEPGDEDKISENVEGLLDENAKRTKAAKNKKSKKSKKDRDTEYFPSSKRRRKEKYIDDSFEQDEEFIKTDEYIQSAVASNNEKFKNLKHLNKSEIAGLGKEIDSPVNKGMKQSTVASNSEKPSTAKNSSHNEIAEPGKNNDLSLNKMVKQSSDGEMYIKTEAVDDEELLANEDTKDGVKQPVSCGLCNETFSDPEELNIHMEMHKETDTYTYTVDGKSFTVSLGPNFGSSSNKTPEKGKEKQSDSSTPISAGDTEEQEFKCHLCPKQYSRANSLKRHLILHTGEKPHACIHCDKKFALVSYLTEHMKMHTGGLPFRCKICHKQFNRYANMKVHMGVHDKEKQQTVNTVVPMNTPGGVQMMVNLAQMQSKMPGNSPQQILDRAKMELLNKSSASGQQQGIDKAKLEQLTKTAVDAQKHIIERAKQLLQQNRPISTKQLIAKAKKEMQKNSPAENPQLALQKAKIQQMQLQGKIDQQKNLLHLSLAHLAKQGALPQNLPLDSEEMNLFKPYMDNYAADKDKPNDEQSSEKKEDEAETESGSQDNEKHPGEDTVSENKDPSQDTSKEKKDESENSEGNSGKMSAEYSKLYDDLINTQIMSIINSAAGNNSTSDDSKDADAQMQSGDKTKDDGDESVTVKQEPPDEATENTEAVQEPQQAMYNYVVDGKTYTIPLSTYNSLVNLDKRVAEEEGGKGELFTNSFDIQANVDTETGKKTYTCELCFKSYSRSNSLRRHLLVHTGEKSYECDLCDKKFSIKSYLTAHRKIHSGETPFGCTFCLKQFNRVSNLRAHMLVHTGVKPHSCPVCGKLFNLSSNLKRHMVIHTGIKPHVCSVCGKEFGLSSSLKEHVRVHTGENPYSCDTCGKKFKQHSNFRRHKSIHTGEKRHVCYICNKPFNQSSSLKRHLTIHPETATASDEEWIDEDEEMSAAVSAAINRIDKTQVPDAEDIEEEEPSEPEELNDASDVEIKKEEKESKQIPEETQKDKEMPVGKKDKAEEKQKNVEKKKEIPCENQKDKDKSEKETPDKTEKDKEKDQKDKLEEKKKARNKRKAKIQHIQEKALSKAKRKQMALEKKLEEQQRLLELSLKDVHKAMRSNKAQENTLSEDETEHQIGNGPSEAEYEHVEEQLPVQADHSRNEFERQTHSRNEFEGQTQNNLSRFEEESQAPDEHLRTQNEKQLHTDIPPVNVNPYYNAHPSDMSSSGQAGSMLNYPTDLSVNTSGSFTRELNQKLEPSHVSPNTQQMSYSMPENMNPYINPHAPDFRYPYQGGFMPRLPNEAYFGNPGVDSYGMPSFRMNIPISDQYQAAQDSSFSMERTADKNMSPYMTPNFWSPGGMSNQVPVITDTSPDNQQRNDMPNEFSEDFRLKQDQWYQRKF